MSFNLFSPIVTLLSWKCQSQFIFYWCVVELQCCVNYCCTAKRLSLYIYIYIQLYTVCNTMDYSPPGSSVPEIIQARMQEWVGISSPRGMISQNRKEYVRSFSCSFPVWFSTGCAWHGLCFAARPCCLSVLCVSVCMCWPHTPNPTRPHPSPPENKSTLYVPVSVSVS